MYCMIFFFYPSVIGVAVMPESNIIFLIMCFKQTPTWHADDMWYKSIDFLAWHADDTKKKILSSDKKNNKQRYDDKTTIVLQKNSSWNIKYIFIL